MRSICAEDLGVRALDQVHRLRVVHRQLHALLRPRVHVRERLALRQLERLARLVERVPSAEPAIDRQRETFELTKN